ncbi:MAG: SH3 domain-containing protein, partial [Kiritimatiellia bacterium]
MRRLSVLAISTLLIIGAIVAVVMASGPIKRLAISTYLFKAPDNLTSIISVPAGTPVEVIEQQGQWVKVAITGWVMESWLRDESQNPTVTQATPKVPSAVDIGGGISLSGVTFASFASDMSKVMG